MIYPVNLFADYRKALKAMKNGTGLKKINGSDWTCLRNKVHLIFYQQMEAVYFCHL